MIQYNSLNLPTVIAFTDGSTTRYTYDATGRKLRVEHKVMTTGVFNPGQEQLDDAGVLDDPGVEMPVPDFPGLNGPAAVMMPQEMEQAAPQAISATEEASGSPKRPRSTGDAPAEYLPYELTVTDYCGNFIYENGKLSRILFDGGYITFPDTTVNEVTIANINKPQYHFYFTDHLGNIRVVTDAQGNIEQVNNYYPYGGLMASSSSIATPSSSYPANQPYRYNGKELDRKNGLDWMDYGARHFAGHGQWTSPDPHAERYYDVSPFVYCHNNPINKIDPDGMDDYYINRYGYLTLKQQTQSSTDKIISTNNNFIEVSKSFIQSQNNMTVYLRGSKSVDNNAVFKADVDMYSTSDIDNATPLYEFLKNSTDVEWSKTIVGNANEKQAFISTTHDEEYEGGQSIIAQVIAGGDLQTEYPNISIYSTIYDASHSHSPGNITVSPGDVKLAKIIQSKFPQAILTIYDGNGYYEFDKNSEAGLLPEIFAIGNAKN